MAQATEARRRPMLSAKLRRLANHPDFWEKIIATRSSQPIRLIAIPAPKAGFAFSGLPTPLHR
jgi:hypothetical protein